MKSFGVVWLVWAFASGFCGYAISQEIKPVPAEEKKCMVWRYEGEKATVYIAGSIHALRKSDYPLPSPYDAAYEDSSKVVFEVAGGKELGREIGRRGTYPEGETLSDHLDEELADYVDAFLKASVKPEALDGIRRVRPWRLALDITYATIAGFGAKGEFGVERHFMKKISKDGKPYEGLVDVKSHVASLADTSEETQAAMLKKTLDELKNAKKEYEAMIEAWKTGNVAGISDILESYDEIPGYREALLTRRNKLWMGKITGYINGDKNVLVVVGAAHLAGHDSVIALLEAEGIEGEQLSYKSDAEVEPEPVPAEATVQ